MPHLFTECTNLCSFFGVPLHKWVKLISILLVVLLICSIQLLLMRSLIWLVTTVSISLSLAPQCIRTFTIAMVFKLLHYQFHHQRQPHRLHSSWSSAVCRSIINLESHFHVCCWWTRSSHLSPFCSDMHWTCRKNFLLFLQKSAPRKRKLTIL